MSTFRKRLAGPLLLIFLLLAAWFALTRSFAPLAPPGAPESGDAGGARQTAYLGGSRSLAVIPFGYSGSDPAQAVLSNDYSSRLRTTLTRIPDLQLSGVASSAFFLGRDDPPALMAERLQVSWLLFGTVVSSERGLELQVSLHDARRGEEAWAGETGGDWAALAGFQQEILAALSSHLTLEETTLALTVERLGSEAWQHLARGRHLLSLRTPSSVGEAQSEFRAAIEREASLDEAWVGLAESWLTGLVAAGGETSAIELGRQALDSALAINPDSAPANGLLAVVRRDLDWNWSGAVDAADHALAQRPGDADLKAAAALTRFSLGRFEEAIELLNEVVRQDPLNLIRRFQLSLALEFSGDLEQSLTHRRLIAGMNPDFPGIHAFRARIKALQGKGDSALTEAGKETDGFWKTYAEALGHQVNGESTLSADRLEQLIDEEGHRAAYQVAEILAFSGSGDEAFEWLNQAREQRDSDMRELIGNPFFNQLHDDLRWLELLRDMGFPLDSKG